MPPLPILVLLVYFFNSSGKTGESAFPITSNSQSSFATNSTDFMHASMKAFF